ncbi:DNA-binding transcriptional LysR family regulator [Comamonas sp. BIGb0124]|uniref:LysR family transcriptional regulator n=1 Tax=Comamonas sp. BIGb0124 TaxID=2485130 RepID=UPI000F460472|nr:LysR family transcriptional regulator [Comamonas sp. BIGb0124]ROR22956.1 DNA-binding transcriptional LysR family regulator [Comamonas sp. BIGb0124]
MDLSNLDIFCAIARHSSVTRAAHELQRAQSNVTTRLRQLESELGVELFLRSGKRMTLTPAGQTLLGYAERLLALAAETRQALHPGDPRGLLRLGTMESTAASRLPQPLARFHQQWPQVQLTLDTNSSGVLLEQVAASRLDAAFVAILPQLEGWQAGQPLALARQLPASDNAVLHGQPVYRETLMLVLPAGHPPVQRPDQVQTAALAAFDSRCSYRTLIEHWFTQGTHAVPLPRVLELKSYHAILAAVASGSCAGIVPQSVLALQVQASISSVRLGEVDTWLVQRRGYRSPALEALLQSVQTPASSAPARPAGD